MRKGKLLYNKTRMTEINSLPNARELLRRGQERYRTGDVEGAIADFTEAIRLDPALAEAYNYRGAAQEDSAAALADYTEALRLDSGYLQAYYNRGFLRGQLADYSGAIADFTRILQIRPDHPQASHIRLDIAEWRARLTDNDG